MRASEAIVRGNGRPGVPPASVLPEPGSCLVPPGQGPVPGAGQRLRPSRALRSCEWLVSGSRERFEMLLRWNT